MKAIRIHKFGDPDVLQLEDVPVPQPGANECLVRIHAASVNPVDYKIRRGQRGGQDMLPLTLGRDMCGVVERCGPGFNEFREGDTTHGMLGSIDRGTYAEYVIVKPGEAVLKPARLSHAEAAAVPLAALTAWQGLFEHGKLQAGQTVLIHGGSGGVGHFAVQLAKAYGATVLTTVSGANVEFVRELGADRAINYQSERFEEIARDVDVVLDLVGAETQKRSWSVLKAGGTLVSALGEPSPDGAAPPGARGVGFRAHPDAGQLTEIDRLIEDGKVRVVVFAIYPLAEAREAHERLEHGHVRGKIVLTVSG